MHANNTEPRTGSPTADRTAAIRQSLHLYATALGLSDERTAEVEAIGVDLYAEGESAAWAIAVAKTRAQELSRGDA